jgi:hypothetical protein
MKKGISRMKGGTLKGGMLHRIANVRRRIASCFFCLRFAFIAWIVSVRNISSGYRYPYPYPFESTYSFALPEVNSIFKGKFEGKFKGKLKLVI